MFGNNRFNALNRHPGYNDIGTAASIGGSLISGAMGGGSASDAAGDYSAATEEANRMMAAQAARNDRAFQPYENTGVEANNKLAYFLGLGSKNYNPYAGVTLASMNDGVLSPNATLYGSDPAYAKAFNTVLKKMQNEGWKNNATNIPGYAERAVANALGHNWGAAGADAGGDYGSLLKNFTNEDFVADPGYQFRLDEGLKGIDRAAAARGGYDSGATLKALERYNQDYASNEFGNAYNRDASNKGRTFNFLSGMSGQGLNATSNNASANTGLMTGMANNTMQNGLMQGQYGMQGAESWNNAIQGGIGNLLYGQRTAPSNSSIYGGGGNTGYGGITLNSDPWYKWGNV